ncbi:DUF4249 domain-containing protein [Aquimarina longa]|uniref:DUF4249 domain-containing protein n=1 Tax=Aquimarina longa TaxID=1080221 RepID=UPI000781D71F|nr:DUF4249 domain-containing protein [Aquimarina longa]
MKTYIKSIILIIVITFTSCSDVINVDVPVASPRLVVEASIDWQKGTSGNEQSIKLTTSTPYFDKEKNNKVQGASVKIINDNDGTEFIFIDQKNGNYITSDFVPVLNQSYTLEIIYNNEVYIAKETMTPVTDVKNITQSIEDEVLEVNLMFDDPKDIENFYFVKFKERGDLFPELFYESDEFSDGNEMKVVFSKEEDDDSTIQELKPGSIVDIKLHGISKRYYKYIRLMIDQSESDGGPFSTTPAPLRGNCTNQSKPENYAFGYFRLTQVIKTSYTLKQK